MLGPWIKVNWKEGQTEDGKREHQHFKNGLEWANLIQMIITSATVGKNLLEEME